MSKDIESTIQIDLDDFSKDELQQLLILSVKEQQPVDKLIVSLLEWFVAVKSDDSNIRTPFESQLV